MLNKIFKIIYIILIVVFISSFFQLKKLPTRDKILPELMNEPIQATSTVLTDFNFDYKNTNYHVKPIADYELWGLVVTMNNINAWYNMYHDKDSVNLKDVCVIWGDNLSSDVYQQIHYKSGEWTCYTRWYGKLDGKFYGNKLSNNHLLSNNKQVLDIVKEVRIGDQIHLSGTLASYAETGAAYYRNSSLSRDDTGNGACETFFVQKAEILKKGMPTWYLLNNESKKLFIYLIILQIMLFWRKVRQETKILKHNT